MPPEEPEDLERTPLSREVEYQEGGSGVTLEEERRGPPMTRGALYAAGLALLIGWIPVLGPVVVGFLGGWLSQSRMRGIYATQIAAFICLAWLWLWTYIPDIPLISEATAERLVPTEWFFGLSVVLVSAVVIGQYILCLLFGWIGGAAWERRRGSGEQWPRPA